MNRMQTFINDEQGAAALEYGLLGTVLCAVFGERLTEVVCVVVRGEYTE